MTSHDDDRPDFIPPDEADLPRPVPRSGPETPPLPSAGLPPAPPLPAAQPAAHDPGSGRAAALKIALFVTIPVVVIIAMILLAVIGIRSLESSVKKHVASGLTDPPSPSAPAATTNPPTPTPSPTTAPAKPKVAGWWPVVHAKRGIAYDVPHDWEVESADTIVGFEDVGKHKETLAMSGAAEYAAGYCTNDDSGVWRAVSGVAAAPKSGSLPAITKAAAESWGGVYDEPESGIHAVADAGAVRPLRVKGAEAYHSRVTVTATGGDACAAHAALVDVLAVRGPHSNGIFVLAADQGAKADEDRATLNKIVKSVRVYRK